MGLFTDGASSRLRRLVAEWVASLARVPALPTDGMHAAGRAGGGGEVRRGSTAASTRGGGSDGGWGVEVRAWAVPCGARWEARVVLDYLANIRGSLAPHARDEQRDVLTKLTEVRGPAWEGWSCRPGITVGK